MTNMLLLNVIVMVLIMTNHFILGDDCNGDIHTVTYNDIYNGLDPKISGPSTNVKAKHALYLSGLKNTMVTVDDTIQLIFNSKESVNVRTVIFTSYLASTATITLNDENDQVITRTVEKHEPTNTFYESISGLNVKSVDIQLSEFLGGATMADISDLQVQICVTPCENSSEITFENHEPYFQMSSTHIDDVASILKGSGFLVIPDSFNNSSNMIPVDTVAVVINIELDQAKDVAYIYMEMTHVNSLSVKMYDVDNKRVIRDTVVGTNSDLLEAFEHRPLLKKITGVKSIKLEFRVGDYDAIGIQNLAIGICS